MGFCSGQCFGEGSLCCSIISKWIEINVRVLIKERVKGLLGGLLCQKRKKRLQNCVEVNEYSNLAKR